MAITLTTTAADVVRGAMEKDGFSPASAYLRVGVKGGGCAGMSYNLTFENEPGQHDQVFESLGVRILVDRKSFLFINGTEIDYGGKSVLTKSFQFKNPNVVQACGCGTSFMIE